MAEGNPITANAVRRVCAHCGDSIPEIRRRDVRYCSPVCRRHAKTNRARLNYEVTRVKARERMRVNLATPEGAERNRENVRRCKARIQKHDPARWALIRRMEVQRAKARKGIYDAHVSALRAYRRSTHLKAQAADHCAHVIVFKEFFKLASDEWLAQFWIRVGKPWNDPRLTPSEKFRVRYHHDVEFALRERMRRQLRKAKYRDDITTAIRNALKRGGESPRVESLLGYSITTLRQHLERQFTKGMNWDRFARGEIHIDHIIPQSAFNLSDEAEWVRCWSLTNLRPLWAKDNRAKRDKVLTLL